MLLASGTPVQLGSRAAPRRSITAASSRRSVGRKTDRSTEGALVPGHPAAGAAPGWLLGVLSSTWAPHRKIPAPHLAAQRLFAHRKLSSKQLLSCN